MAYEFHKIANIFPLIEGEELQALADDIKAHGLKQPVILFEGRILDGRNRSLACELAGVVPQYEEFHGTAREAIEHVWSINVHRRHLNSSQAAIAAVKRLSLDEEYAAAVAEMKDAAATAKRRGKAMDPRAVNTSWGDCSGRSTDEPDVYLVGKDDLGELIPQGKDTRRRS